MNYRQLGALLSGRRLKLVDPAAPADIDAAPNHAAPAAIAVQPTVPEAPPAPRPIDVLLSALDKATDDAQRGALIAAAPIVVREELGATLTYRQMIAPARNPELDAMVAALDGAADDAQRTALLSASSIEARAALAERLWWRTARADDAWQRYLALLG